MKEKVPMETLIMLCLLLAIWKISEKFVLLMFKSDTPEPFIWKGFIFTLPQLFWGMAVAYIASLANIYMLLFIPMALIITIVKISFYSAIKYEEPKNQFARFAYDWPAMIIGAVITWTLFLGHRL